MPVRFKGGGGSGGGLVNRVFSKALGLRLTNQISTRLSSVRTALRVSSGPATALRDLKAALRLSNIFSGTIGRQQARVGFRQSSVITPAASRSTPAVNIVQVTYALSSVKGSNAATQTPVNENTSWVNLANAQGVNNGTEASMSGSAIATRGGRLDLAYADYVDKTALTITKVELRYYGRVTGTVLNNADVRLQYALGAGVTTLATITGDDDYASTPKLYDITSAVGGDWSKLDALTAHVYTDAAVGEIWQAFADAVTVTVTATRTDAL